MEAPQKLQFAHHCPTLERSLSNRSHPQWRTLRRTGQVSTGTPWLLLLHLAPQLHLRVRLCLAHLFWFMSGSMMDILQCPVATGCLSEARPMLMQVSLLITMHLRQDLSQFVSVPPTKICWWWVRAVMLRQPLHHARPTRVCSEAHCVSVDWGLEIQFQMEDRQIGLLRFGGSKEQTDGAHLRCSHKWQTADPTEQAMRAEFRYLLLQTVSCVAVTNRLKMSQCPSSRPRLLQSRDLTQSDALTSVFRHASFCQSGCNSGPQVGIRVAQNKAQMICSQASRPCVAVRWHNKNSNPSNQKENAESLRSTLVWLWVVSSLGLSENAKSRASGDRQLTCLSQRLSTICTLSPFHPLVVGVIFAWRSTCWWRNVKALNTMVHPSTHMELAQSRGASGTSWRFSGQDGSKRGPRCTSRMDMKDFGTFAVTNVMHCVMNGQNKRLGNKSKQTRKPQKKEPS